MALSTPIGYVDSSDAGDFQYIDSDGKTFLAYKAGEHLYQNVGGGSLTLSSTDATLIGSLTDTRYSGYLGYATQVDSGANIITTVTNVYQKETVPSESDSDFRRPIGHDINGVGQHYFKAMDDTNLNILVDDLLGRIFKYDMIGSYQLGSSAPSSDYVEQISNVMTDTRADSADVVYNIYQRTSMTVPTHDSSDFPLILKDSDGSYSRKLIRMDSDQMISTFGQRARKRIVEGSGAVGTYQIRSSAQGAPTDTGTWVAKGTATDTRNPIVYTDYLGNYTADYLGNYIGNFVRDFTRTRQSNYTTDYLGDYIGAGGAGPDETSYVGTYTGGDTLFVTNRAFSDTYTGDYTNTYYRTSTYSRDFYRASTYSRDFIMNVDNYVGAGPLTPDGQVYTRNSAGYLGNYLGPETTYPIYYTGAYTGAAGDYLGEFFPATTELGTKRQEFYARNFFRTSTYTGNYFGGEASYTPAFDDEPSEASDYSFDYLGTNYSRSFARSYFSGFGPFTPLGYYMGSPYRPSTFAEVFTGNYFGLITYIGDFTGSPSVVDYLRNAAYGYTGDYQSASPAPVYGAFTNYAGNYTGDFIGNYINPAQTNFVRTSIISYVGEVDYSQFYTGGDTLIQPAFSYTSGPFGDEINYVTASGSPETGYIGSTGLYARDFFGETTYSRTFTRTSTYSRNFVARTSTYSRGFARDSNFSLGYVGNYAASYIGDYTRNSQRITVGNYIGDYAGNYIGGDTEFIGDFLGAGEINYVRTASGFSGTYTDTYTRNFSANYTGGEIVAGTTGIETYTLYVRIA